MGTFDGQHTHVHECVLLSCRPAIVSAFVRVRAVSKYCVRVCVFFYDDDDNSFPAAANDGDGGVDDDVTLLVGRTSLFWLRCARMAPTNGGRKKNREHAVCMIM